MGLTSLFRKTDRKTVLNVGGGSKQIPLPARFIGYEQVTLDIDPRCKPDIVGDARELYKLKAEQFDAVYSSHNLEHFYHHEVPVVLEGMYHVLKKCGQAYIRVPDIVEAIKRMDEAGLDLEDGLYLASGVPIMTLDVIYGWSVEIERSGQPFYAHKTAFTQKSLTKHLEAVGFRVDFVTAGDIEFKASAYKS